MTRIVKHPDERRKEILETAAELFQTIGYAGTTVEAIIRKMGVAKGTFYHYFKSKEEILTAVVQNLLTGVIEAAREVATNPDLDAMAKLRILLGGQHQKMVEARNMNENLHRPENRELHEKTNVEIVLQLSPILAEIIEQGVREGVFRVSNAQATIQFMLAGSQFLLDEGLFNWSTQELLVLTETMAELTERVLGAETGTFRYLSEKYKTEA